MVNDTAARIRQSKVVGFLYVITTLIGLLNTFVVKDGVYDVQATMNAELQFRAAQILDLIMFILVIWLSLALFLTTRAVNDNIARLAMLFRFGEGVLGCMIVVLCMTVIGVLGPAENAGTGLDQEQLFSLAQIFFRSADYLWSVLFVLMGIGASLFMYLLLTSKSIPVWLAIWGLFTYATMVFCFGLKLLIPDFPQQLMLVMAPGALFEFVFGVWLLIKGINVPRSIASAQTNAGGAATAVA
jgi:hypothetical protein